MATAGMRALPVGIPKLMVSTVAAGDVAHYVGGADIMMFHSVADVQGLNSITEQVLANAAHAMAGMVAQLPDAETWEARRRLARPAVGITMFGVTTPCVQALAKRLEAGLRLPGLPRHRHRRPGRWRASPIRGCWRRLSISPPPRSPTCWSAASSRRPPTGSARHPHRHSLCRLGRRAATWSISVRATACRSKFRNRNFVIHNPNVTLMRTTRDENRAIGEWIGARLNEMNGPVRFLLPHGGVSVLDAPGKPFHDPEADRALFEAIEQTVGRAPSAASSGCRPTSTIRPSSRRWSPRFTRCAPKLKRSA